MIGKADYYLFKENEIEITLPHFRELRSSVRRTHDVEIMMVFS